MKSVVYWNGTENTVVWHACNGAVVLLGKKMEKEDKIVFDTVYVSALKSAYQNLLIVSACYYFINGYTLELIK